MEVGLLWKLDYYGSWIGNYGSWIMEVGLETMEVGLAGLSIIMGPAAW